MSNPTATTEVAVKTISTQEVRQLLDSKRSFQFWNVLTDEWFKGENIAGSRRVPLDKVGNEVRSTNLPRNAEIVVYCGGPKCPQSRKAFGRRLDRRRGIRCGIIESGSPTY